MVATPLLGLRSINALRIDDVSLPTMAHVKSLESQFRFVRPHFGSINSSCALRYLIGCNSRQFDDILSTVKKRYICYLPNMVGLYLENVANYENRELV